MLIISVLMNTQFHSNSLDNKIYSDRLSCKFEIHSFKNWTVTNLAIQLVGISEGLRVYVLGYSSSDFCSVSYSKIFSVGVNLQDSKYKGLLWNNDSTYYGT